jgi:hypothetical protein
MDNGLTISAYNGEKAIISGGRLLTNLKWKHVGGKANIFAADLSSFDLDDILGNPDFSFTH